MQTADQLVRALAARMMGWLEQGCRTLPFAPSQQEGIALSALVSAMTNIAERTGHLDELPGMVETAIAEIRKWREEQNAKAEAAAKASNDAN